MASISIVPGTELFYDVLGTPPPLYPLPTDTLVGSGAVLADADDSTYIDLAASRSGDFRSFRTFYAKLETSSDLREAGLTWSFRANQTTTDVQLSDPAVTVGIVSKDDTTGTEDDFGQTVFVSVAFEPLVTNSGFTTYTGSFTTIASAFPSGFDAADILAMIAAGDAWLLLNTFGSPSAGLFDGLVESWVSEFSIYNLPTGQPPLRLTNRDDQYSSAPSLTRRTSRQGSNRLTGYL